MKALPPAAVCRVILLLGVSLFCPGGAALALQPGDILNQDNWQEAQGLLPPEILVHYQKGEYANPIVAWPEGLMRWDEEFRKATEANVGRFTVNERGTIIDKKTGKQPAFIYGFPFPHIDPQDPHAAVKILWNHYYGFWSQGNNRTVTMLNFINRRRLQREISEDVYFLY